MNQHIKALKRAASPLASGSTAAMGGANITTWNPTARTFEAVISTDAPILQEINGEVVYLSLPASNATVPQSVALLNNHRNESIDDRLGMVTNFRAEGGNLVGTCTLSPNNQWAERLASDNSAGMPCAISPGFSVEATAPSPTPSPDGRPSLIATKWILREVSVVLVPADQGAGTRSLEVGSGWGTRAVQAIQLRARAFGLAAEDALAVMATTDNLNAATDELQRRVVARQAPPQFPKFEMLTDNRSEHEHAFKMALANRMNPQVPVVGLTREYRNNTTLNSMRMYIEETTGQRTRSLTDHTVARTMIGLQSRGGGMMSSSDYPGLMTGAGEIALKAFYEAGATEIKTKLATKTNNPDYRARAMVGVSTPPKLKSVAEGAEYQHSALVESADQLRVHKSGVMITVTEELVTNDRLNAIGGAVLRFSTSANERERDQFLDVIEANGGAGQTLGDGTAVFHANHGNVAALGAALTEETLSSGRLSRRKAKGLGGELLNVPPRYLVVPAELETTAEKLVAQIQAASASDVNPFAGKLEVVVESGLKSATRWYLVADPQRVPSLIYGYLEGAEGPQIFMREGFEVDGLQWKCKLVFGAAFIDHRGWYMNPGE